MSNILKILYIKNRYRLKYYNSKSNLSIYDKFSGKKKCIVFLAADYGNLGDVAITYAQEKFLQENYPDFEIIDVPISITLSRLKSLRQICTPEDIITIVGGGNMSDLYFDIELLRQMVVKAFPNNLIISFPQTMFFSDSLGGKYLRYLASKTYSSHKNIIISAREQWTYDTMKLLFPKCVLLPDIVMTLDRRNAIKERDGITLCLRNDSESNINQDFKDKLKNKLASKYKVSNYDTHIGHVRLSKQNRMIELSNIWAHFCCSEWVITDRLHGMIFAFITGTPCIVLPNNNNKIEGCYSWIKDCGYIYFLKNENIESILQFIKKTIANNFDSIHNDISNKFSLLLKHEKEKNSFFAF